MDPLTTRVKKKKKKKKNTLPRIYIDFLDARNRNFVSRRGVFFSSRASSFVSRPSLIDRLSLCEIKLFVDRFWFGLGRQFAWIAMHFEFSNFRILGISILWGKAGEVIAYAVCQLGLSLRRKSVTLISRRSDLLSFRVERDIRGEEGHRNGWWEIFRGKKNLYSEILSKE